MASQFWDQETDPSERNKILGLIFEQVTFDEGRIVSVTPRDAFMPYFQFGYENGGLSTGATGLEPATSDRAQSRRTSMKRYSNRSGKCVHIPPRYRQREVAPGSHGPGKRG